MLVARAPAPRFSKTLQTHLITLSILLVAVVTSLWNINSLPSGIHSDEAWEGIDAARILYQGARPIFLPDNNGRQPLFAYLVAFMFWMFGPTTPAIRLAAGLPVIGIVFGAMKTGEELFNNRRVGWLTGIIAGTTLMLLRIDRLGTRVSVFPMFLNLAVWQVVVAVKTRRMRHWVAGGILLGLTYYTYLPSLFIPIAMVAIVGISALFYFSATWSHWRGIVACGLCMSVVAAPLFLYYVQNQATSTGRGSQLIEQSFSDTPEATRDFLISRVGVMAAMFTVQGDDNPRHNIPGRPIFDPAMAVAFVIGLGLSLLRKNTFYLGALGLVWLVIFLTPSYLTEAAPHFLRSTGILPILFLYPALGLEAIRESLYRSWGRVVAFSVVGGFLLASINATVHDYFLANYLATPEVFLAFDGRESAVVLHTNQVLDAGWTLDNIAAKPLVPPPFTLWIQPGLWPAPEDAHTFAAAASPDQYPFFKTLAPDSTITAPFTLLLAPTHQAEWLAKLPASQALTVEDVTIGTKAFSIYRSADITDRPYTRPGSGYVRLDAGMGNNINLLAAEFPLSVNPGDKFDITVHLVAPDPAPKPEDGLRFDVYAPDGSLVSEVNKAWEPALAGPYTDLAFKQSIRLATPPGAYTITVTRYNLASQAVMPFTDAKGKPLPSPLPLGMVQVFRPKEPPTLLELNINNSRQYNFGPLTLLSYAFDRDSAKPGDTLYLDCYFLANQNIGDNLSFNLFTPYLPTSQWKTGDLLHFRVPLVVPIEAQGQYQFELSLNQNPDRSVLLNPINIIPVAANYQKPDSAQPLTNIQFGKVIELSGYTLHTDGQGLALDLVWHALNVPQGNWVAFIHIEDDKGNIVGQSDSIPVNGSRPTTGWRPGEYIVDTRQFAALPPGHYNLYAGLYDPVTGQRLDERLKIGTYTAS